MYLFVNADNEIHCCLSKYICFSKLSIPVQQLISGVNLSEIWIKCFENWQMGTIRTTFDYYLSYLINYLKKNN